eukprot:714516-Rhodomonas_salina.1
MPGTEIAYGHCSVLSAVPEPGVLSEGSTGGGGGVNGLKPLARGGGGAMMNGAGPSQTGGVSVA